MRRSAAPSLQSSAKRLRFLSPLIDSETETNKENDLLDYMDPEIAEDFKLLASTESKCDDNISSIARKEEKNSTVRSTNEILDLILGINCDSDKKWPESDNSELEASSIPSGEENHSKFHNSNRTSCSSPEKAQVIPVNNVEKFEFKNTADSETNVSHYNVLWCKRSTKKHKIWEGDGVLIVRNRSAVLKNSEGKEIDRGIGYKFKDVSALEEGSKFFIGGKECEIQSLISSENCKKEEQSAVTNSSLHVKSQKLFKNSKKTFNPCLFKSPTTIEQNSEKQGLEQRIGLLLPTPSKEHQDIYNKKGLPLTEVIVDSFLEKCLRLHQIDGIIFMYKCILGFQHDFGQGVILADEMGLGKTLQCIALIWTLMKQGPYGGKSILKRVIIITPSSLVTNWKKEFHKWLGESRLSIFVVDKKNLIKNFVKIPKDILIISYEMFLRSAESLSTVPFDLVICDEGHRIKNLNIKISNVINCLSTTRRILLTGTPIQNDLAEFFSIVDFVNPGALGSIKNFRSFYEKPILQSRNQDCSEEEKEIGEEKSEELNKIVGSFLLRRTQDVINSYLPPKSEIVVFCRPTELQKNLYDSLLGSRFIEKIFSSGCVDSALQLIYISMLRKLCNHPSLLHYENTSEENINYGCLQSVFPTNYQPSSFDSGKMKVLEKMLSSLFSSEKKEKVVIVSGFTMTLNLIEKMCKEMGHFILRLDGSTASSSRQEIVDVFNRSYTKYNIFLLSNKAGGVGLNLIGASRIILYDVDWNPANDLQAMARIWRDGQKHSVYVYRLLTTGTIEEKIYQRQLSKQCLSGAVLNPSVNEKLKFSQEELKDLFSFHGQTECLTHELINCSCLNSTGFIDAKKNIHGKTNVGMEELMNWQHICGPISQEKTNDIMLKSGGSDITFLFVNKVNFSKQK